MSNIEKGYIQVYTGDGKGKTTAALGLCFRAAGQGFRSRVIQFMKGQIDYGELKSAERSSGLINITQCGRAEFVSKKDPEQVDIDMAVDAVGLARQVLEEGQVDILVLDEANVAVDFKLISEEQLLELIRLKPERMELVITGRSATPAVIEAADLVTEMREVKHYWQDGVMGRKGIEL